MGDSTIVRLEQGRITSPSPAKLSRLATALHLSLADIYARAGYFVPDELPSFDAYLQAKYPELSVGTQDRIIRFFRNVTGTDKMPRA